MDMWKRLGPGKETKNVGTGLKTKLEALAFD